MNFAALKIAPVVRKYQGQPPMPRAVREDVILEGKDKLEFVTEFLAKSPHVQPEEIRRINAAAKLIGRGTPPIGLADPKCIGVAFGRYWYTE
ncbi:MAG: hypothetical protein ACLGXA_25285 [Acidobacteriota bacterium]